jgi:hypothetical protein
VSYVVYIVNSDTGDVLTYSLTSAEPPLILSSDGTQVIEMPQLNLRDPFVRLTN